MRADDPSQLQSLLEQLRVKIDDTTILLDRIGEHCAPHVFYHDMRPFWAGYGGTEKLGSIPGGIFYETDEHGQGELHKHGGGTAAQSSLYHLFDIGLGVEHLTGNLKGMRQLMPRKHREFLEYLEEQANVRQYVLARQTSSQQRDDQLWSSYEEAVAALVRFRDSHMRMASKYIARASRESGGEVRTRGEGAAVPAQHARGRSSIVSVGEDGPEEATRGTGGTSFLPFLRQLRDETRATGSRTPSPGRGGR